MHGRHTLTHVHGQALRKNVSRVSGVLPKGAGVVSKTPHVLQRMLSSPLRALLPSLLRADVGVVLSVVAGRRACCRRIVVVDGDGALSPLVPRPTDPIAGLGAATLQAYIGAAVLIQRTTDHAAAVAVDDGGWSARSVALVMVPDVALPTLG